MNTDSHIGQYKIVRTLGAGGMGTVFLGEHILLGRLAAIKTLLPTLSTHREIVERFFNEARAISTISDPGVVQIYDFGYHVDGTAYIVMEYLEGESLADRIERLGTLPLIHALRIARQIAHSLGAAHAAGIVHRDLKPSNVFLIYDPEAQGGERTKILDFGICKLSDDDNGVITQTGMMLGTPVYMSPEQCRGNGRVDHRSDIYSVGCALFHMLTGRPPFDCDSIGDYVASHIKEPPAPPSMFARDLPEAVDALVMRCLEKSPLDRFQTMTELHADIEHVLSTLSDRHNVAASPGVPSTPLGAGFRSAYDVNRGPSPRTAEQTPTGDAWFVDSLPPVPASSITDEWLAPKPHRSWAQRFALALALGAGAVGGIYATSYAMQEADAKDVHAPAQPGIATVEEPQLTTPQTAIAREAMPFEQIAERSSQQPAAAAPPSEPLTAPVARTEQPPVQSPAAPAPAAESPAAPPPAVDLAAEHASTVPKPTRPPRPHVKSAPRPRRVVPLDEPSTEDLYDTR